MKIETEAPNASVACRCVKCPECFTGRHERCAYGCLTTEVADRPSQAIQTCSHCATPAKYKTEDGVWLCGGVRCANAYREGRPLFVPNVGLDAPLGSAADSSRKEIDVDAWIARFVRPHLERKCDGIMVQDCVDTIREDMLRTLPGLAADGSGKE